jgi:RNA-directed DNA polymerase
MLPELDVELSRREHRFCRFADDCNVYVKTKRAGQRVYESIVAFLKERLLLEVNEEKSAVDWATRRKFLGFSFHRKRELKIRLAKETQTRVKDRVRELTSRTRGVSLDHRLNALNAYLRRWVNYFALAETASVFEELEKWIHRRVRQCILKTWKRPKTRYRRLRALGVSQDGAAKIAGSRKGS